jgi:hypothetical protein
MSDRLAELRRQRALVQQHVEWLDREIAAEAARLSPAEAGAKLAAVVAAATPAVATPAGAPPLAKPVAPTTRSRPSTPSTDAPEATATPEAERILDEFRVEPTSLHSDVRKGCLLYFAAALALFAAVVALLYFTLPHKELRPRSDPPEQEGNAADSSQRSNEKR